MTCKRQRAEEFRVGSHERIGRDFYDEQFAVPQSAIESDQINCLEVSGKLHDFREQLVGHELDRSQRNLSFTRKFEIVIIDMIGQKT